MANPPPKRDVLDLARRFRVKPGTPAPDPVPTPDAAVRTGDAREFWVSDSVRKRYFRARAVLFRQTAHVDFYVQDGERVDDAGVARSLDLFESVVLPRIVGDFGGSRVSADRLRITILNVRIGGLVGYYSSVDEHPRWAQPFSNERPLIVMSLQTVQPGSRAYNAGLAHELQHLVQWRLDPAEDTWVNEGTAELAIRAAGLEASSNYQAFLQRPDTQLNHWSEQVGATAPHYGASDLFFTYLADRFGGYGLIGEILASRERGIAGVDAVLRREGGASISFDSVFLDWIVANWANRVDDRDGRYGYQQPRQIRARDERLANLPARLDGSVPQYATRYFELPTSAAGQTVSIEAPTHVRLIAAGPRPGAFWWSGRADSGHSRLWRSLDLRGAHRATLRFKLWHDLERDYDYGYVTVSSDGGKSWVTVPGRTSVTSDPNGANYGAGFTGKSGGDLRWIDEEVDLTPFAGREIVLAFEVVTDDAYSGAGLAVDDIQVPEIGLLEEAGADAWQAAGFTKIENRVPQRLTARVIAIGQHGVSVFDGTAGADGRIAIRVPETLRNAERVGLAVAAHTPLTIEPASFELAIGSYR